MSILSSKEYKAKRFGEKLRFLRLQRKITLQQLAINLGLKAHGYLSELENGRKTPSVELILRVAYLFNVTTDELLKDELEVKNADLKQDERQ